MKKIIFLPLLFLFLSGCYSSIKIELRDTPVEEPVNRDIDSLRSTGELETHGGLFHNSLVPYRGWLFVAEGSGRIHAFDMATLEDAGYASVRNSTVAAPPVFVGNKMFYLFRKKLSPVLQLAKYDITLGKEEFTRELGIEGDGSLFGAAGGLIVIADRSIHFVDTTGAVTSNMPLDAAVSSRITQSGELIIAGLSDGRILELNTSSKTLNFFITGKSEPVTSFLPVGDNYIVCLYGGGMELVGRGGYIFWQLQTGRIISEPVIFGGSVFTGDLIGILYKINLKTGDLKNKFETGGLISEKVTVAGQKIILPVVDGRLILIDPIAMKAIQTIETGGRVKMPVTAFGKRLFAGCDNNRILLFEF